MKRKAEVKIGSIIILTLLFFGVFLVFSHSYGDIRDKYDVTPMEGNTSEFYDEFEDYSDEVYGYAQEVSNKTESAGGETTDFGYVILVDKIWQAVKITFKLPKIFYSLITNISILIGIPIWLQNIILGIVITSIAFLIIYAALRWK